jgi:hypothetical protein
MVLLIKSDCNQSKQVSNLKLKLIPKKMDNAPPIGITSCNSPDVQRVCQSDQRTSTQDETFANARCQLKATEQPPQSPIPPPVPNPPPMPLQPQPQLPAVDAFEDAQADIENLPGNEGGENGNQAVEWHCHIINVAGNQMCIRDAHVPPTQFQGTKTWDKAQ